MSFPLGVSVRGEAQWVQNQRRLRQMAGTTYQFHQHPRQAARAALSLRAVYPWLSPQVTARLGAYGVQPDNPDVAEIAGVALGRRVRRGWIDGGGRRNANEVRNVRAMDPEAAAAARAGVTVDQYRQFSREERIAAATNGYQPTSTISAMDDGDPTQVSPEDLGLPVGAASEDYARNFMGPMSDAQRQQILDTDPSDLARQMPGLAEEFRSNQALFLGARNQQYGAGRPGATALALTNPSIDPAAAQSLGRSLPTYDATLNHIRRGGLTFQGIPLPNADVSVAELRDLYTGDDQEQIQQTLQTKRDQLEDQYDLRDTDPGALPDGITPAMRAVYDGIVQALDVIHGDEESVGPDLSIAGVDLNVSDLWNAPYDAAKGTVRTATMAMDALWQGGQARFRQIVSDPTDAGNYAALNPLFGLPAAAGALVSGGDFDPLHWQEQFGQTDLGITLERLANGQHVSVGEGFYVNPNSDVGQQRLARERQYGLIDGHVITMGRQTADWAQLEPDTLPFDIVSGAVDLAWMLAEPGGALVDAATRSRQVRRALAHAGGFAETRSVAPQRFDRWLRDTDAQRIIQHYADLDSPEAIARSWGSMSHAGGAQRMPEWAHYLLADGAPGDTEYVEEMLRGLTGQGYNSPGIAVRGDQAIPGLTGVVAPGVAFRRRLASSRLAHDVPETGARALDVYNPESFVGGLRDSLVNARVPTEVIDDLVHRAYTDGYQVPTRPMIQRYERQLADLPDEGTVVWRGEDTDVAVVRQELTDTIDELRPGLFINTVTPRRNVLFQIWEDAQDAKFERLVEGGIDEGLAEGITSLRTIGRRVMDDHQAEGLYWLRLATDDTPASRTNRRVWGVVGGEEMTDLSSPSFAHMAAEHLTRYLPLEEDPRQIARLTRHPAVRAITEHIPLVGTTPQGQVREFTALADRFMSRVWKPTRILRPAYVLRVPGEEQFRMGAAGFDSLFTHPMGAFALIMGTREDGRLHRGLDALTMGRVDDAADNVTDIIGTPWEQVEEFRNVLNRGDRSWLINTGGPANGRFEPHAYYNVGGKLSPGYNDARLDQIGRMHSDDLVRRLAQIELGEDSQYRTIDELIEAGGPSVEHVDDLRMGGEPNRIRTTRADLMDSHPVLGRRGERSYADRYATNGPEAVQNWDDYVESLQVRLFELTGRDPDLLHAVARGEFPDGLRLNATDGVRLNPRAVDRMGQYVDTAPQVISGDAHYANRALGRVGLYTDNGYDRALAWAFAQIGQIPTDRLSRSPAFRQFYTRKVQQLLPFATPEAQQEILANASELMKIPDRAFHIRVSAYMDDTVVNPTMATLRRAAMSGKGDLGVEMVDEIAKYAALDETRWLLYDVHKRGQLADQLRLLFPFFEAWKEVATRWIQLTAQRPGTVMARATQLVQATGSPQSWESIVEDPSQVGWIHQDSTGETVFSYPAAEWFTQSVTGVPMGLSGSFNGLSITSSVLPGVGPVVQAPLAMSREFRDSPRFEGLRNALFPYGIGESPVDNFSEWAKDLFLSPAWQRVIQGAATAVTGRAGDDRLLLNSVFDVMRYNVSTGEYNTQSTPAINRLINDSTEQAGLLYLVRGLAGLVLPSAPLPEMQVQGQDGQLLMLTALAERYRQMQDEDFSTASRRFLDQYGDNLMLVLQSKTVPRTTMLPVTSEADRWVQGHPGIMDDYPLTFGLWAPGNTSDGDFDFDAYNRYVRDRAVKVLGRELEVRDLVYLANDRVASDLYRQREEELLADERAVTESGNLTEEAQRYLSTEVTPYLRDQYPGFGSDSLQRGPSADDLRDILGRPGQTDTEVRRAVDDRRIPAPLRSALRQYVQRSDDLFTELADNPDRWGGSTTYFESTSTRSMRDHLRNEVIPFLREELPEEYRTRWDVIVERLLDRTMIPVWLEEVDRAAA